MVLKKFFRARGASCVLYNRTGHNQGFSVVKYNATQACSMEKLTDLYNLLTFEYITLLACLKESHVNYNDLRESFEII